MEKIISTNPARNFQKIGEVEVSSKKDIAGKVRQAHAAKNAWKDLGVTKRKKILAAVMKNFIRRRGKFVSLMTREIGKPVRESEQEFDSFFLEAFRWFLANCEKSLSPKIVFRKKRVTNQVVYEPHGVAAVILPWNFPLEMFVWGVVPNLLAGNTVVMKHSELCPLIGKEIEKIMKFSGLPKGVFGEVYGDGKKGEALAESDIDLLWFTGSSKVGKHLFEVVSGKSKFVKSIMELGGSNPGIIFEDGEIDDIADFIVAKRFLNCGQACTSLKRLIVHESLFENVVEKIKNRVEKKIVGDPFERKTDIGSLASKKQLLVLKDQLEDALQKDAKVVLGGKSPVGLKGAYFLPTILTNVSPRMRVWREEVFGPILPVVAFSTEKEAIELANGTPYGLGANIFTKDKTRFARLAGKMDFGMVRLNTTGQDYAAPFGGFKMSGTGREHGEIGFQELCQIKVKSF